MNNEAMSEKGKYEIIIAEIIKLKNISFPLRDIDDDYSLMSILLANTDQQEQRSERA